MTFDGVALVKAALDTVNQDRERLAFRLGVSVHTVRQWVYGRRTPDGPSTYKMLQMTGRLR